MEATGWTEASSLPARGTGRGSTRGALPWSGWRRLPEGSWPVRWGVLLVTRDPSLRSGRVRGLPAPPHRTRPRRLRCRGYHRPSPAGPTTPCNQPPPHAELLSRRADVGQPGPMTGEAGGDGGGFRGD